MTIQPGHSPTTPAALAAPALARRPRPSFEGAPLTLLCAGLSGYLGHALARTLHEPASMVVRSGDPAGRSRRLAEETGASLTGLRGDIRQPMWGLAAALGDLAGEVRLVVNLAANTSWTSSWQSLDSTNVEGARHAVDVAAALDVPLVHISTLFAAYQTSGVVRAALVHESADLTKYERSKCRAEWAVHDAARSRGVPVRIVRVGALAGDRGAGRGRPTAPLARSVHAAAFGLVPYVAGARLDVAPRDLVAARVAEWLATPIVAGCEVVHVGLGHQAPLVESLLAEVVRQGMGDQRRLRAVRVRGSFVPAVSRWGDRFCSGAAANVLVGSRYFASRAVYESDGLGDEVGIVELAATLTGSPPAPRPLVDAYYRGWLS